MSDNIPDETFCGRSTKDDAFTRKTARVSTDELRKFFVRPCRKCLRLLINEQNGKYHGIAHDVDDLKKRLSEL